MNILKRLLTCVLCFGLVLSVAGCNEAQEDPVSTEPVLQVGYARADITPRDSVPMGGYGDSSARMSEGVAFPLYSTCIAFTYGEEKVLLITEDLLNGPHHDMIRPLISNATGIPVERILICTTHSHHTPDTSSNHAAIAAWKQLYITNIIQAAQDALADCAPATLYLGETKTEKLNFVRHYLMSDGSYAGDNFGDFYVNTIVDYATKNDPQMVVLRVDRGDKKGITLVNWQAHPCKTDGGSANRMLSPDFIAPFRTSYEEMSGMHFAYFTGAAGNQNLSTKIATDSQFLDFWQLGQKLATIAYETAQKAEKLEGTGITTATQQLEYAYNHDGEDKLAQAKEVVALSKTSSSEANKLAQQYGFTSVLEANGICARVNRPATGTYEIDAMNIAGFTLVTAPYEMFSDMGLYIKENSPFKNTMIFSLANGLTGYFPTEAAFDYRSYEGTTARYARGCAEHSAKALVALLEQVK